jgi:hypothetical protein
MSLSLMPLIAKVKKMLDDYLDASVSSRLSSTDPRVDYLDASVNSRLASADSRVGYLDTAISGIPALTKAQMEAIGYTNTRALKIDNLDTTISSRAAASTALNKGTWSDTKASYLDTTISSRAGAIYVYRGAASITTGTTNVNIGGTVTLSKAFLIFSYYETFSTQYSGVRGQILNTTQIQFNTLNPSATIYWQVVTFG